MKFAVKGEPYEVMVELIKKNEVSDDVKIMEGIIWNKGAVDGFTHLVDSEFKTTPTEEEFADYLNSNVVEILEDLGLDSEN
jgi:hypothetical protein